MTFVFASLTVIWICGVLFLAGLLLNDVRLIYNNIAPGAVPSNRPASRLARATEWLLPPTPEWVGLGIGWALIASIFKIEPRSADPLTGIDPATLNEAGRAYLERTIRHKWIMLVWVVAGFVFMVWAL